MPGKLNRSHKGARRARRAAQGNSATKLPLAIRPIPSMRLNCVFKQEVSLTETAAGLGATKWFRVGGVYDPDQSAGGPGALGFNQYASLFTSYRVMAMRFHAVGVVGNPSPSGASFAVVTLTPNPRTQTLPADPALWGGEPGAISVHLTPQAVGGKNTFTIDKTFVPWQILKIKREQYIAEAEYASLVTTTPTKEPFVALSVNGLLSSGTMTMTALVTISYDVQFFEPNLLVV